MSDAHYRHIEAINTTLSSQLQVLRDYENKLKDCLQTLQAKLTNHEKFQADNEAILLNLQAELKCSKELVADLRHCVSVLNTKLANAYSHQANMKQEIEQLRSSLQHQSRPIRPNQVEQLASYSCRRNLSNECMSQNYSRLDSCTSSNS